jgi:hypothetical protein
MTFDIERFRDERLAIQRSELTIDPPDGPLLYSVRARSSFRVFPEWTSRNRREVSERLASLSEALKGLADENGGFQAIEIYAIPADVPAHPPELVSFYKYSLFQESWVHLSGLDFAMEPSNAHLMNEQLRKFERQFLEMSPKAGRPNANARSGEKITDPIDDPEVDDDPTPAGMRKRPIWREAKDDEKDDKKAKPNANKAPKPGEKRSDKSDTQDDEEEPPEDEEEPEEAPVEPDEDEPANDGTAGSQGDEEEPENDGASTKSPPPKAGAQTMGPKAPSGGVAPPPKGKALKMPKKKGVMGMDPDKDGFAKHGQRMTLPSTVMGASRQINLWRAKYLT